MDAETSTSSSCTTAGHRLYRTQNLESAQIYFFKEDDPDPAEVGDLRAGLFNMEGITLSKDRTKRVSLESIADSLQTVPDKARYEASLERARRTKLMLNKLNFDAVEDAWMVVNDTVLQILMDEEAFGTTRGLNWNVDIRPQGKPKTPLACAKPDRGFGFARSRVRRDALSRDTLDDLSTDPRIRLIYSPQRVSELIFPFCVYEAKSAIGGALGFAENKAAVGAATAATLFSELAKLSDAAAAASSIPPVMMLASMGATWSIHACFAKTVEGVDEYHVYPLTSKFDLTDSVDLFQFQVALSRIRDYALIEIKPWVKKQVAGLRSAEETANSREKTVEPAPVLELKLEQSEQVERTDKIAAASVTYDPLPLCLGLQIRR